MSTRSKGQQFIEGIRKIKHRGDPALLGLISRFYQTLDESLPKQLFVSMVPLKFWEAGNMYNIHTEACDFVYVVTEWKSNEMEEGNEERWNVPRRGHLSGTAKIALPSEFQHCILTTPEDPEVISQRQRGRGQSSLWDRASRHWMSPSFDCLFPLHEAFVKALVHHQVTIDVVDIGHYLEWSIQYDLEPDGTVLPRISTLFIDVEKYNTTANPSVEMKHFYQYLEL